MRNPFRRQPVTMRTIPEFVDFGCDESIVLIGHALDRDVDGLVASHEPMTRTELRTVCSALAIHCAALLRSIDPDDPRQVLQDVALKMRAAGLERRIGGN